MSGDQPSIHILRKVVIDGFLICGLTICLYTLDLLWKPFQRGFFCGDQSLMFPYHEDTITVPMIRIVGLGLPIFTFLICEWALLRKERDEVRCLGVRIPVWVRGFYCALASFGTGVCFSELATNFSKNIIGRNRPHFFDLCQPSTDCRLPEWHDRYIQSHEYTCTGGHVGALKDLQKSFLSGHSSWSAYTMIFLAMYLEKRMVWKGTRLLRHSLQFCAVMLSWITTLSRVSDYKHHWSDVLAGYCLGLAVAVIMWTWGSDLVQKKKNHSPLPLFDMNLMRSRQMALKHSINDNLGEG